MPRLNQIVRQRGRIGHHLDGAGTIGGADAGGHALGGINTHLKIGAKTLAILGNHLFDSQLLEAFGGGRHADQSPAESRHEVYGFGRGPFAGHDEVSLVFAVFIIDDNHHPAPPEFSEDVFNGRQPIFHMTKPNVTGDLQIPPRNSGRRETATARGPTVNICVPPAPGLTLKRGANFSASQKAGFMGRHIQGQRYSVLVVDDLA